MFLRDLLFWRLYTVMRREHGVMGEDYCRMGKYFIYFLLTKANVNKNMFHRLK
jgi:predicted cupin superfamily sugar epimerase